MSTVADAWFTVTVIRAGMAVDSVMRRYIYIHCSLVRDVILTSVYGYRSRWSRRRAVGGAMWTESSSTLGLELEMLKYCDIDS